VEKAAKIILAGHPEENADSVRYAIWQVAGRAKVTIRFPGYLVSGALNQIADDSLEFSAALGPDHRQKLFCMYAAIALRDGRSVGEIITERTKAV